MTMIYKYVLQPGRNVIQLPQFTQVLTVQMQDDDMCLWARVNITKPLNTRVFDVVGTGHAMSDDPRLLYVATVQMAGGALVWHVFESTPAA